MGTSWLLCRMSGSSSGVKCSPEVMDKYNQIKTKKPDPLRYVLFNISANGKEWQIGREAGTKNEAGEEQPGALIQGDISKTLDDVRALFVEDEPVAVVCEVEFEHVRLGIPKSELLFISWCPDTLGVKKKMLFASSKNALKKKFDGLKKEIEAKGLSD